MMAQNKGGGGISRGLFNAIWLIVVAGAILGWARSNDITTPGAFVDYVKAWSDKAGDKARECASDRNACGADGVGNGSDVKVSPPGLGGGLTASPIAIKSDKAALLKQLEALKVAPADKNAKYNRDEWKHWVGSPCDAREATLKGQGVGVKTGDGCSIKAGTWTDPYSGVKINEARSVDIDHMLPLGWVAKHGGQVWPAKLKQQYANDPLILVASSAKENRSKSDRGPASYMPPNRSFHCAYSALWVQGATKYKLWIEPREKTVLLAGLKSCA